MDWCIIWINYMARKRAIMATGAIAMTILIPFIFAPLQRLVSQHEPPVTEAHVIAPFPVPKPPFPVTPELVTD